MRDDMAYRVLGAVIVNPKDTPTGSLAVPCCLVGRCKVSETRIERDEMFPFYVIDIDWHGSPTVKVPTKTLDRWRRVMAEFESVQEEIEVAWMEQTDEGKRHAAWRDERDTQLGRPRHTDTNH